MNTEMGVHSQAGPLPSRVGFFLENVAHILSDDKGFFQRAQTDRVRRKKNRISLQETPQEIPALS